MIEWTYATMWVATATYFFHAQTNKLWLGRLATALLLITEGGLTAGLVQRSLMAGHWPLTSRYEFSLCFTWAILMTYFLLEVSWRERRAGHYILSIALMVMTYAVTRPSNEKALSPLLPVLRTVWLQLHVLTAAIGYGALGVAAGLGWRQLRRSFLEKREPPAERPAIITGEHLAATQAQDTNPHAGSVFPSSTDVGITMERVVALGFPWLTLSILIGA
ncbi:MAG: cytochrome c biogenesis protein CcsA, partial [Chloroflexota bacterium]